MDKSKHNLRSNFLLVLFAISSFSLFAQKQVNTGSVTLSNNNGQTGTTQIQSNRIRNLSITSSTTAQQERKISGTSLGVIPGNVYTNNILTSAGGDMTSNSNSNNDVVNCPMMYVQVTIPFLQSCVNSVAQIDYCNHGTATAINSYVDVELPAELSLDSAEIPYTVQGANVYRFQLGNIPVANCNQFELYFTTTCDSSLIGDQHCIQAHIYPDTLCNSVQNTPLITVNANCNAAGKTTFTLNNHGTEVTLDQYMQLIVIEDHLLAGGTPAVYLDDTLELESQGTFARGFTGGQQHYELKLTDGQGNQLVHSRVNNCYAGSQNVVINTFHTHQHLNQFGNGGILPSISQGCAINGEATAQTNSSFIPAANSSPNYNNSSTINSNNNGNTSDLEQLEVAETTVKVFPNPFNYYTTVEIEGPIADRFMFRLYDATGKIVRIMEIEGQRTFQIERENLLQGMYLYQIEAQGKFIDSGKLIIK